MPVKEAGTGGYLRWFLDDKLVMDMDGEALKKRGLGAKITSEISYILLNTAVLSQWCKFISR